MICQVTSEKESAKAKPQSGSTWLGIKPEVAPDVLVEHFEWAGFGTCRIFCLGRWGWRWSWCSGLFGFYSNSCLQSCHFMLEIAISVDDSFEKIQEPLAEPKPWQCNAGGVADRLLVNGLSINQNLVVRDLVYRQAKEKSASASTHN